MKRIANVLYLSDYKCWTHHAVSTGLNAFFTDDVKSHSQRSCCVMDECCQIAMSFYNFVTNRCVFVQHNPEFSNTSSTERVSDILMFRPSLLAGVALRPQLPHYIRDCRTQDSINRSQVPQGSNFPYLIPLPVCNLRASGQLQSQGRPCVLLHDRGQPLVAGTPHRRAMAHSHLVAAVGAATLLLCLVSRPPVHQHLCAPCKRFCTADASTLIYLESPPHKPVGPSFKH